MNSGFAWWRDSDALANALHRIRGFMLHLWHEFDRDGCFAAAGLLTYTTLLSIVPLFTVALAIASAFPVFDDLQAQVQDFIFQNFVPATGQVVQEKMLEFTERALGTSATVTMTLFLVVTALLLMSTIEKSLNDAFGVKTPRSLPNKIAVYWSALTFGPLLVALSVALSSYVLSLPVFGIVGIAGIKLLALKLSPFIVAFSAFMLMYLVVPNRNVSVKNAAAGALLAALLFEVAKRGFATYISSFNSYQVLYGPLSAVAIFLIWVYLGWMVTLLGAAFASALGSFRWPRHSSGWPPQLEFVLLYRVVGHLWQAQKRGEGLTGRDLFALERESSYAQLQLILERLRLAGLVRRDDEGEWILARDPTELTLADLYESGAYRLPRGFDLIAHGISPGPFDGGLESLLAEVGAVRDRCFRLSLKALYTERASNTQETTAKMESAIS